MILCLDVGNTQIYAGVFNGQKLILTFRHNSHHPFSSDQFGIFLKSVLRENDINQSEIHAISICSVVPHVDYTIRSACLKYFQLDPFFLQAGVKTGLKICYRNPLEVGADRIANAVAAISQFPKKNIIIVDFGTATTLCALSKDKQYLGGVIMPGMKLSMTALQEHTAKLSSVEIIKPKSVIGRTTTESIQAGLYYGQYALIKELTQKIKQDYFPNESPLVLGTGGFSHLFSDTHLFNAIIPDLVLHGLYHIITLNHVVKEPSDA